MKERFLSFVVSFFLATLLFAAAQGEGIDGLIKERVTLSPSRAGLSVSPEEVDFGETTAGDVVNTLVTLNNRGSTPLPWTLETPEGWESTQEREINGLLAGAPTYIYLSLRCFKVASPGEGIDTELAVMVGAKTISFKKRLPYGSYHFPLLIKYLEGEEVLFVNFELVEAKKGSPLIIDPPRLDLGVLTPQKVYTRQIKITNRSGKMVSWRLSVEKGDGKSNLFSKRRYISFQNEEAKGLTAYLPPVHLREFMEVTGSWRAQEGYPAAYGTGGILKYHFKSTGMVLYLRHGPEMGKVAVYLDGQLLFVYNAIHPETIRAEVPIAYDLPEGPHVLAVATFEGMALLEGVTLLGKEVQRAPSRWLSVLPDLGTTGRETDYVNIRINVSEAIGGTYGASILLNSSAGSVTLEAFWEVKGDSLPKFLDVYRYVSKQGHLYTVNPQGEIMNYAGRIYRKEGIAFRLFPPGTPGTTPFYHWFNRVTGDSFYSYDLEGNRKNLNGYVFEGSIGNIATSRLANTRELYRWYHPRKRLHFYTTNGKGEGMGEKGYNFDGIAGYVR